WIQIAVLEAGFALVELCECFRLVGFHGGGRLFEHRFCFFRRVELGRRRPALLGAAIASSARRGLRAGSACKPSSDGLKWTTFYSQSPTNAPQNAERIKRRAQSFRGRCNRLAAIVPAKPLTYFFQWLLAAD